MNRVIIITCGTSLLETSCWEYLKPNSDYVIHPYNNEPGEKRHRRELCRNEIEKILTDNDAAEKLGKTFIYDSWDINKLADLPAELASLKALLVALHRKNPSVTLGKGDKIVLLYSTNDEGKFCAETLEYVLKNILHESFKDVDINPEKIEDLDPKDAAKMIAALRKIWSFYKNEISEKNETHKYIFNLTGGYKATAMVLAGLSSLLSSNIPVPIVYLHEESSYDNLFVMRWEKGLIELDSLDFNNDSKSVVVDLL